MDDVRSCSRDGGLAVVLSWKASDGFGRLVVTVANPAHYNMNLSTRRVHRDNLLMTTEVYTSGCRESVAVHESVNQHPALWMILFTSYLTDGGDGDVQAVVYRGRCRFIHLETLILQSFALF